MKKWSATPNAALANPPENAAHPQQTRRDRLEDADRLHAAQSEEHHSVERVEDLDGEGAEQQSAGCAHAPHAPRGDQIIITCRFGVVTTG